jgi:hypothetical protein
VKNPGRSEQKRRNAILDKGGRRWRSGEVIQNMMVVTGELTVVDSRRATKSCKEPQNGVFSFVAEDVVTPVTKRRSTGDSRVACGGNGPGMAGKALKHCADTQPCADDFYDWAKKKIKKMRSLFASSSE